MYLYVFLGKKLISVDTILPVIISLKNHRSALKVRFFVPDKKTFEDIQKNTVLSEFINSHCKITRLGGLSNKPLDRVSQRFVWICSLLFVFITLSLKLAKAIHFGALEEWPRRFVTLGNRKRIFLFENNGWGTGEFEDQIDGIARILPPVRVVRSSQTLVSFSHNWRVALSPENVNLDHYIVSPSKLWPSWRNYLRDVTPKYLQAECERLGIQKNEKVIVFILGTLDALPSFGMGDGPIDEVVINTLRILNQAAPDTKILLKPHPITQMKRLEKIVLKTKNACVTYLHPGVLSEIAFLAVCNYYSTALIDLWFNNVPTVEYSKYSVHGKRITSGGSMRPEYIDHFVELEQKTELAKIIAGYVNSTFPPVRRNFSQKFLKDEKEKLHQILV